MSYPLDKAICSLNNWGQRSSRDAHNVCALTKRGNVLNGAKTFTSKNSMYQPILHESCAFSSTDPQIIKSIMVSLTAVLETLWRHTYHKRQKNKHSLHGEWRKNRSGYWKERLNNCRNRWTLLTYFSQIERTNKWFIASLFARWMNERTNERALTTR